jgi:hypothetical protein
MAFEIIKTFKTRYSAMRLIGKRYTDDDRVNGSFGAQWGEWHQNGWFGALEKSAKPVDGDFGYFGLMTFRADHQSLPPEENGFAYWIGILFPPGTPAPDGFDYLDLPESDVGVSWIYGSSENGEIYGSEPHSAAYQRLCGNGWSELDANAGGEKLLVFFENYTCPRFTKPDGKGNVILDYGFYLK